MAIYAFAGTTPLFLPERFFVGQLEGWHALSLARRPFWSPEGASRSSEAPEGRALNPFFMFAE